MPSRPWLPGQGDIECRIVILLREFFHRRNIAIPLSYLLLQWPLAERVLSFTKKCARNCLLRRMTSMIHSLKVLKRLRPILNTEIVKNCKHG